MFPTLNFKDNLSNRHNCPKTEGTPSRRGALVFAILILWVSIGVGHAASPGNDDQQVSEGITRLPGILGNNMVLQCDTLVNIWGWDKPDIKIELKSSWGEAVETVSDDAGSWKASIQTPEAGGPYELTIVGTDTIHLSNILMGEVWLCSGQSNMEMPLKGFSSQPIVNSQEELLNADKPEIRFFIVERNRSHVPELDVTGRWEICTPDSIRDFSAVGYFFGRKLLDNLDVPIGLIGSYWGGTVIEAWTDRNFLESRFTEVDLLGPATNPGWGTLYNGMIHPIVSYTIRGTIWYQGETNRFAPEPYERLLPAMIEDWRRKWNQGDFPFYYVQIAPYQYDGCKNIGTALLRESQLKASSLIENAGMVVSLDYGNCKCIHPFEKRPIGERLAYWALKNQYGFSFLQTKGPELKEMRVEGNQAILSFDNALNGIISRFEQLDEFEIAGANKIFYPATAFVNGDSTLTVSAPEVADPVAVRYAFRNCPKATLFNTEGLPASSFRTDDW
jgi:sialate O-acetylesterase